MTLRSYAPLNSLKGVKSILKKHAIHVKPSFAGQLNNSNKQPAINEIFLMQIWKLDEGG